MATFLLSTVDCRRRVVFCSAFRRLQQKAQVFAMEPNAAVRSRLTHSLEVSQMGRFMASLISSRLVDSEWATPQECAALVTFVENACLMHDIGNPPFGHFGEAAISIWFRKNGHRAIVQSCGNPANPDAIGSTDSRVQKALDDFLEFDGNPQGLRIVAKLQRNSDSYGLNLTATSLAAFLKYTRAAGDGKTNSNSPFHRKCGYFTTEQPVIDRIRTEFGYEQPQRFPLAYIMEAADDLAYCISDLEDSIEKGLVSESDVISDIFAEWSISSANQSDPVHAKIDTILRCATSGRSVNDYPFTYADFRTALNRVVAEYAAEQYIVRHVEILQGTLPSLLSADSPVGVILQLLKEYCRKRIYGHESIQRVELAGYSAIYGILEHFACLLEVNHNRFMTSLDYSKTKDNSGVSIVLEKKYLRLFPKNYIKVYRDELQSLDASRSDFYFKEWQIRAHLVVDFISGMTDDFAMSTFRTLSGMRL